MGRRSPARQIRYKESRDKLARTAAKFDKYATTLLSECFESDGTKTGQLLMAHTQRFPEASLLKVSVPGTGRRVVLSASDKLDRRVRFV